VSESLAVIERVPEEVHVPDTLPVGLPALEPVGGDAPTTAQLRHVVAA
jgi:hypothetical protein